MGILFERKIVKTKHTKAALVFENLFGHIDFEHLDCSSPKDYIKLYWDKYMASDVKKNNSLNGSIFELVIHTLLYKEGIVPFYTKAKVAFVPNIEFDTLLYTPSKPICLSLKTSLRERYKQADLEAIALRYVHRKSQSYLLTMDSYEAKSCNSKIKTGEIIGIDEVVDCNTEEVNQLIKKLHEIKVELTISPMINVVEGNIIQK